MSQLKPLSKARLSGAVTTLCALFFLLSCGGGEVANTQGPSEPTLSGPSTPQDPDVPSGPAFVLPEGVSIAAGNLDWWPTSRDGVGAQARGLAGEAIAIGPDGNLYVLNEYGTRFRKVTPGGTVTTLASNGFAGVSDAAVDASGNLYVISTGRPSIQKIGQDGVVCELVTPQIVTLPLWTAPNERWEYDPRTRIAVDATGNVYAKVNFRTIVKLTQAGVATKIATFPGTTIHDIAVDRTGNLFALFPAGRVVKVNQDGGTTPIASFGVADQDSEKSRLTTDTAGNLYVLAGTTVSKVDTGGVVTKIAQTPVLLDSSDNPNGIASISFATDLAVDGHGNVFLSSTRPIVQRMNATGTITTLAGSEAAFFGNTDGPVEKATFSNSLRAIASGRSGNTYVTEGKQLRKIDASGNVSTINWHIDSQSTAPSIKAVTSDSAGNLYLALGNPEYKLSPLPTENQFHSSIRKITPDGKIITLAGPSDVGSAELVGSTDGTGATARFNNPGGIVADEAGNLYVTDTLNSTVRKVTPEGVVTTVAGQVALPSNSWLDTEGLTPRFSYLGPITIDRAGNLYVTDVVRSDAPGGRVRKITPQGFTTTVFVKAGEFYGLTIDAADNLYLSSSYVGITKATPSGIVTDLKWGDPNMISIISGGVIGSVAFSKSNVLLMAVPGAVLRVTVP